MKWDNNFILKSATTLGRQEMQKISGAANATFICFASSNEGGVHSSTAISADLSVSWCLFWDSAGYDCYCNPS